MYALLYGEAFVDRVALRRQARDEVMNSSLIRECAEGNRSAAIALLEGFWPFVDAFEKAIDRQVSRLPIKPLIERFGQERVRTFFSEARAAVKEMHEEEGSHAKLWQQSAVQIGASLDSSAVCIGVENLLKNAKNSDPVQFFCWLAGTEYIAEELSAYLCRQEGFLNLFPERRWVWGDAHIEQHEGPSHLEIDEDLARAYHPSADPDLAKAFLFENITHCEQLFGAAAADVQRLRHVMA